MKSKTITSRRNADGTYSRLTGRGWELEKNSRPLFGPNFPEGEPIHDRENPPLTEEQLARRGNVPPVRKLRRALLLTQEEFSERYQIPLGTLRDWEQERTEPDAPARAYLKVISADPEGVAASLVKSARSAAE